MNRTAATLLLAAIVLPALAGAGCNRRRSRVIGVVPKGSTHVFWQTVHAGAIQAGRETGFAIL